MIAHEEQRPVEEALDGRARAANRDGDRGRGERERTHDLPVRAKTITETGSSRLLLRAESRACRYRAGFAGAIGHRSVSTAET